MGTSTGITIKTQDVVEADIAVNSLNIDNNGNVTLNYQKTLVDDTDNTFQPDGNAINLTIANTDANAQAILTALTPLITSIVSTPPASSSPDSTSSSTATS